MNKRTETNLDELKKMVTGARVKKFVSLKEGAAIYSVGLHTFRELAEDAHAVYKVKRRVLVNLEKMDEFMEIFQDEF